MELDRDTLVELLQTIERSGLDEVDLRIGALRLYVNRHAGADTRAPVGGAPGPAAPGRADVPAAQGGTAGAEPADAPGGEAATGAADDAGVVHITAPMVGTFYRAPEPGADPFVEVGSEVGEDDIVGIIEVMKLMNHVKAGSTGTIAEIYVDDQGVVEYGQPLMAVAPHA